MADFDIDLGDRLSRLAAAVPVSTNRLGPVRRGAVAARPRMALAWAVPLVVGLAVALWSVVRVGESVPRASPPGGGAVGAPSTSLAPSATPPAESPGVVVAVDSDGPYRLELRSNHRVYNASDVIEISGAFIYGGVETIDVQGFKPLVFGVAEPVNGIDLGMATTLECNHVRLQPSERVESPFVKGGGVSASDPDYDVKMAYLRDPVFRLPPGTWHIRLAGWLYEGECGTEKTTLSAELEITVLPDPSPPASAELRITVPPHTASRAT